MLASLTSVFLIGCLILLLMILAGGRGLFRYSRHLSLFFVIYLVDNLVIRLTNHMPQLQILPNHLWGGFLLWGWSGKIYSIVLVLIVLGLSGRVVARYDTGLTFRQSPGSVAPSLMLLFLIGVAMSTWGSMFPKGEFDPGLLLYMAILPGLNEELVYRGILPACLEKPFGKTWRVASANLGWSSVIPTLLFALLHGLWFDSGFTLHLDLFPIRNALISGLIFAWLRERTGSLLMPVLAHGVWDFFFFLPRMV
jgi:CAAX protease family protein